MAAPEQEDRSQFTLARRKAQDRSIVLVVIGIALLLPPLGAVALIDASVAGLPVPLVYVFAVWAFLIAAASKSVRFLAACSTTAR